METITAIAKEKAGNIEGWEPYYFELVKGGMIVKGCIARPKKTGPNKGDLLYLTKEQRITVVITTDELKKLKNDLFGA